MDGQETWRTTEAISQRSQYLIVRLEAGEWTGDITKAKLPNHPYVDLEIETGYYVIVYDYCVYRLVLLLLWPIRDCSRKIVDLTWLINRGEQND